MAGKKLAEFNKVKKLNKKIKQEIKSETLQDSFPPEAYIQPEEKPKNKPLEFSNLLNDNKTILVVVSMVSFLLYKVYTSRTEPNLKQTPRSPPVQSTLPEKTNLVQQPSAKYDSNLDPFVMH